MVKIKYARDYVPFLKTLLKESPGLEAVINEKVRLFERNPDDTRLHNHPLRKKMKGLWAFSINDDVRIVYKIAGKNTVSFLAIGGHIKVYP
ncbi:type II toxin-antitoxin system mRNA interferase toxin, RelE/StbE family [Candidatus Daviesbacteria bacterium]|nr:type II toxin-antitoxin system mRNA interferase toxin, RelE/StbE family [Candidatus Daviesbacteria bacterium]